MLPEKRLQASKLLVQLAVESIEGKQIPEGALERVKDQVGEIQNVYELYSGILNSVRTFQHQSRGSVNIDAPGECVKSAKIPEEYRADLINILSGLQRVTLDPDAGIKSFYLKLQQFRWRIDITISSSALSRVLEPTIIFEMLLHDGRRQTFEVSISKFHELRYNVASILKQMETIEKKKIFKKSITNS